ncbi:hypothetical protein B9J09_06975 [Xylella fastidiosa subsp. pauca]|uniref:hypothetical protein n=1 Tax=Xylella fastidiosa TaxID=2371 RepID=UPI0005839A7D|nr:hypothetical protein [Xylella fastidiosa]ARO68701.1 hypothetical protein B9J09_06390 [Xylella fastidiosa subsp. pauca]ARO68802.1 hypothetical protein B9J09_06975 [Xylella fastidiosa subsp. pauca]AVI20788.1 hypothetical protein BCV75_05935 [Xylella fastidiosa]AVI20874.1 hypothetical protein BCV75_06490 [Xylella fastidiosa]AVI22818.1 hypothetical protein BC375_06000 [Xylella fastidiosa]
MTTIMLKNTRSCDVTLDGVTIQAGRTQALEAAHVEQLRQHPGIGLWFDNGYLVEQQQEPVQREEQQEKPLQPHSPPEGAGPPNSEGQVSGEGSAAVLPGTGSHDSTPGKSGKPGRKG